MNLDFLRTDQVTTAFGRRFFAATDAYQVKATAAALTDYSLLKIVEKGPDAKFHQRQRHKLSSMHILSVCWIFERFSMH